jgi:uncharacterized membrane protein YphA (DoxX/SURF4 family)
VNRYARIARIYFALGTMGVGGLALVYGNAVLVVQRLPAWLPWPNALGDICGALMLATGAGLLFDRLARLSIRILLPFLLLWTLSRVPVPLLDPLRELSWFLVGEIGVLAAAALVLFARDAGLATGSRLETLARTYATPAARVLVGLAVITFGLSHFFEFAARTASLVPAWLPAPRFWANVTGAAQVAAGLGALFNVYPRLAAAAEGAMLTVFALLVWIPAVVTKPQVPSNWVELIFTVALAAACCVVAEAVPAATAAPNVLEFGAP